MSGEKQKRPSTAGAESLRERPEKAALLTKYVRLEGEGDSYPLQVGASSIVMTLKERVAGSFQKARHTVLIDGDGTPMNLDNAAGVSDALRGMGDSKENPLVFRLPDEFASYQLSNIPADQAKLGLDVTSWDEQSTAILKRDQPFTPGHFTLGPTPPEKASNPEDHVMSFMFETVLPAVLTATAAPGSGKWGLAFTDKYKQCRLNPSDEEPLELRGSPGDIAILPESSVYRHGLLRPPIEPAMGEMVVVVEAKAPGEKVTDAGFEGQIRGELLMIKRRHNHYHRDSNLPLIGLLTNGSACRLVKQLPKDRASQEVNCDLHEAANYLVDYLSSRQPLKASAEPRDEFDDEDDDFPGSEEYRRVATESKQRACIARFVDDIKSGAAPLPAGFVWARREDMGGQPYE
ncbi:unnamed protein product [Vitrella brassicaformis CCMP3155]|uniref:Uncharacterized protein n=2 Tax=Vitrella brassicaformis TaxID=1169539 RepID=A0A0G4EY06_VITBC|nr:unnamed protein product [Vitrella brassicaformis CCMP3155]|eukprot:CEM03606.1 unnamed protein product [Vitrella brassicaformis CCMP3155]